MADFCVSEIQLVKPGDVVIENNDRMFNECRDWAIDVTYKENTYSQEYPIEHLHDLYKNMTRNEAYERWREDRWKKLFDPFKYKILSISISRC